MTNSANIRARGSCHCGAVKFSITGPLRDVVECHCPTCRKITGGLWNATGCVRSHLQFEQDQTLAWYQSSAQVRRGFCRQCGSSLFYERDGWDGIAIAASALDEPSGLKLAVRIFTDQGGDFYCIGGDVPAYEGLPRDKMPQMPEASAT